MYLRTCSAFLFIFICQVRCLFSSSDFYTNTYAVHIEGGHVEAAAVAEKHGFVNLGEIVPHHYHFMDHHHTEKRSTKHSATRHAHLTDEPKVKWFEQQIAKRRSKRDFVEPRRYDPHFNDEKWPIWYLTRGLGYDMNVLPAWEQGYTGKGVVVSILDDGIERDHPDLLANYNADASYDVNGHDDDPEPRYNYSNENRHGTRCAGEVAAQANNSICSVGVAYNAGIGGVRMLDGDVTDAVEARSLSHNPEVVDIYSASWGPDDDGETVDGPGKLAKLAFLNGTQVGRGGRGSIFVWASGNGGRADDSCGCDGYTNSIFTISVSSVSETGNVPWYSESCASTMATTYSSGTGSEKEVITTDLRKKCTDGHSGTSASAPLAAGICALALEANPQLTWRDLQHVIVMTARPENLKTTDWATNGAGLRVSHDYGFGLMDAGAMVEVAKNWTRVPDQRLCLVDAVSDYPRHLNGRNVLSVQAQTTGCQESRQDHVQFLEHVVSRITLDFPTRGDLTITLISPAGTRALLLPRRPHDRSSAGFRQWEFLSTHSWGENPQGEWTLEVKNVGQQTHPGVLREWTLMLYGTQPHPSKTHVGPTKCQEGEYLVSNLTEDAVIHECLTCSNVCLTCYGPNNGDCVQCVEGLMKAGPYCIQPPLGEVFQINWLVLFGWVVVLCFMCVLLFCVIFGALQAKSNGYCCCDEHDWASDSEDYEYKKIERLHESDDEESTIIAVKNGKGPPL